MILLLCGPPGAGKTTVAERLRERLAASGDDGGDFRLLHSDDFSRNTYEQMYERVRTSDSARDTATDWILDGTFYRREWQERFRALPDAHFVYVTATLETCLERNRNRAEPIDETGVRVVHAKFERPKNPDLTLDTDQLSVEEAVDAIERYVRTWSDGDDATRQ